MTATTEDGVAMAIEHKTLPVGGVQFHPELLMSLGGEVGLRIVENAFRLGVPVNWGGLVIARSTCDEAIHTSLCFWIASRSLSSGGAAPVIGRAFARPVGADPLARNDEEIERYTDDF